ncbi:flagellar hook protein FlgE [Chelativorans intermedius]|uniref:Flagellar hook protein FlgE n=1 Tax=Chelativorans intermedius TaxID=515947 RepID=A0ABV6D8T9_9HYPH|nr:flagellar hook protein FlgE [Chelativorans intermedius]MCT8997771.1 flagellar hook protein FlgE [Chelativorans intermedius]
MSLYGMMKTGVSGMNGQANRLSTVADNIANSSTNGYKRASTEFSSLVLPSTAGAYNSGGVTTTVRHSISTQGVLQYTTSVTDLAIDGDGFFKVQNADGQNFLTRAGSFVPDEAGRLVNAAGFYLIGKNIQTGAEEPISIEAENRLPTPSSEGSFAANLPADADVGHTHTTSLSYVDQTGNTQVMEIVFEKVSENVATGEADWDITVNGNAFGTASFNASAGTLTDTVSGTANLPMGQTIALDFSLSQTGNEYQLDQAETNGTLGSEIDTIQIDTDGTVYAQYEDGSFVALYEIQFGKVASPDQLEVLSGNVFAQSPDSGPIFYGNAAEIGVGKVVSGALENSNVDIAEELTEMIQSQRSYTANSKVFQTGSELMEVLVNLKR